MAHEPEPVGAGTLLYENVGDGLLNLAEPEPLKESDLLDAQLASLESRFYHHTNSVGWHPDIFVMTKGFDLLNDMWNMSVYASPMMLRLFLTLFKGWEPVAAVQKSTAPGYDESQRLRDDLYTTLTTIGNPVTGTSQSFRDVLWNMMLAFHAGHSVQEKLWRYETDGSMKGKWVFRRFVPRLPGQVGFDIDPATQELLNIIGYGAPQRGESSESGGLYEIPSSNTPAMPLRGNIVKVNARKFVTMTYRSINGLPYGLGEGRVAWKHVHIINEMYRIWALAAEKFGSPLPFVKVQTNSKTRLLAIRQMLDKWRQSVGMVVPNDVDAQLLEAVANVGEGFERLILHHRSEIIHLILGQSLTTGTDGKGSYAIADVHADTQEAISRFGRHEVEASAFEGICKPWTELNYGRRALPYAPHISLGKFNTKELDALFTALGKGVSANILFEDDVPWMREWSGTPPRVPGATTTEDKEETNPNVPTTDING